MAIGTVMVGCVLMNATASLTRRSSTLFFVDMLVRPRINFDPQKIEQSTPNSQVTRTIVVQDAEKKPLGQYRSLVERDNYEQSIECHISILSEGVILHD